MRRVMVGALALLVPREAAAISAVKLLQKKLKSVDGAGSGLDADTVRGMTPHQIVAQMQAALSHAAVQALTNIDPRNCLRNLHRIAATARCRYMPDVRM